jgi:diguanylate cyclase (GGDEF)-like protein
MPHTRAENPNAPEHLLAELETLRRVILSRTGEQGAAPLALVRVCRDLDLASWKELSAANGLQDWVALPLDSDLYPTVLHMQGILEKLSAQTEHDPITGLPNKLAFDRILDLELERSLRIRASMSVALVSIDDFESIKLHHGPDGVANVLVTLAKLLSRVLRRYDFVARISENHFGIILSGAGIMKSEGIISSLIERLRHTSFTSNDSSFQITCSIGLSGCRGRVETTTREILDLTNQALESAKERCPGGLFSIPLPDLSREAQKTLVHSNEKKFLFTGCK